MAISVGALEISISASGERAVTGAIDRVDAAARRAAGRDLGLTFKAPDFGGALRGLQRLDAAASKSIGSFFNLGGAIKGMLGPLAIGAVVGGVVSVIGDALGAANRFNTSLMVLSSTAKVLNIPLSVLQASSATLQRDLGLSATQANTFTAAASRLTSQAGVLNQTGNFTVAWMNLAAARGLSAAEAMGALETTITGQDEGLNKLGLKNPSGIYADWALAAGRTVASMTEQEKWLAIVNQVMTDGALVTGTYLERLDSAAGAGDRLANAKERVLTALGLAIIGENNFNEAVTTVTETMDNLVSTIKNNGDAIGNMAKGVATLVAGLVSAVDWMIRFSGASDRFADKGTMILARPGSKAYIDALMRQEGVVEPTARQKARTAATEADARTEGMAAAFSHRPIATTTKKTPPKALTDKQRQAAADKAERDRNAYNTLKAKGDAVTLADRAPLAGGMPDVATALGLSGAALQIPVTIIPDLGAPTAESAAALFNRVEAFAADVGVTIADSISAGFGAAWETVFAGGGVLSAIGAGFQALTTTMLGGLGQAMVAFGTKALLAAGLMAQIQAGLNSLLPGGAMVAAIAMIAIGSALSAAAGGMFGGAGGGKRGGGGGGRGGGSAVSRDLTSPFTLSPQAAPGAGQSAGGMNPNSLGAPAQPIVINNLVAMNPRDPTTQSLVTESVRLGVRRGLSTGGG